MSSMWTIPEDVIPTYFLMMHGPELKKLRIVHEHDQLIINSIATSMIADGLYELLTPQAKIALKQAGSTNHAMRAGLYNMRTIIAIQAAKLIKNAPA